MSKIMDGLGLKGLPAEISGASREELPQFFVERGYKVGAEIGVYLGEFSAKFCKAGLKMYSIDPWMSFEGQGRREKLQEVQDGYYETTKKNLAPYPNSTIIRKTSMDAVKNFKDGSLDFAYIDGDHTFRFVAEDVYEWTKKVRSGGVVCGHDYWHTPPTANNVLCHVDVIVDAYVKLYGIENFYIFGREKAEWRKPSWMFIKK